MVTYKVSSKKSRFAKARTFVVEKIVFLNGIISIIILGLILALLIYNSLRFFLDYPAVSFFA